MTELNIDAFLKLLPQLIKENDAVKGAIITALTGVMPTREDILEFRKETNARFEQMDKRFEQMDKRFEQMDKRFELMLQQMDKRFESMQQQMDKRFLAIDKKFEGIQYTLNRMESKEGSLMEKAVLESLKEVLSLEKIDPTKIRKEYVKDPQGQLFWEGYSSDIDILMENGGIYAVEIKANVNKAEVEHFKQVVKLYELRMGKTVSKAILIVLRIPEQLKDYTESLGIRVVASEVFGMS